MSSISNSRHPQSQKKSEEKEDGEKEENGRNPGKKGEE